jgi:hypothetical protein
MYHGWMSMAQSSREMPDMEGMLSMMLRIQTANTARTADDLERLMYFTGYTTA